MATTPGSMCSHAFSKTPQASCLLVFSSLPASAYPHSPLHAPGSLWLAGGFSILCLWLESWGLSPRRRLVSSSHPSNSSLTTRLNLRRIDFFSLFVVSSSVPAPPIKPLSSRSSLLPSDRLSESSPEPFMALCIWLSK
jgi:hypothetical protein